MAPTPPLRQPGTRRTPARSILLGIARVACGRVAGLAHFAGTQQAFLASLAPLLAFPLVGTALLLLRGGGLPALADLFATITALLAPSVLSFEFARWWQREAEWLRFATTFNWCQWALPVVVTLLLTVLGVLSQTGLSEPAATVLLVVGVLGYGLWLHWFIARHALRLSGVRAGLLVLGVNLGTALLILVPRLIALERP
jgi:hypothetical protein